MGLHNLQVLGGGVCAVFSISCIKSTPVRSKYVFFISVDGDFKSIILSLSMIVSHTH